MHYLLNMSRIEKCRSYDDCGEFYLDDNRRTQQVCALFYMAPDRYAPEDRAQNFLTYILLSLDENVSGIVVEACDILEPLIDAMRQSFARQVDIYIPVVSNGKIVSVRSVYKRS